MAVLSIVFILFLLDIKDNAKGCVGILCTLIHKINKEVIDAAGPQLKTVYIYFLIHNYNLD